MKSHMNFLVQIVCVPLVFLITASLVYAEVSITEPSLTVIVNNKSGSERLVGVEVTIEDNYPVLTYRVTRDGLTDEKGEVTFDTAAFDTFTVYQEGAEREVFEYNNNEKTYNDNSIFKVRLIVKASDQLPEIHEIEVPVNENVEYTIDYNEL